MLLSPIVSKLVFNCVPSWTAVNFVDKSMCPSAVEVVEAEEVVEEAVEEVVEATEEA